MSLSRPQGIGVAGLGGFFVAWWVARFFGVSGLVQLTVLFLVLTGLPMVILSLVREWESLQLKLARESGSANYSRMATKGLGLVTTFVPFILAYTYLPLYSRSMFRPVMELFLYAAPLFAVSAPLYILWVDRHMANPHDAYWQLGRCALGRWGDFDRAVLWQHALGWTVKGFFLPLMLGVMGTNLPNFVAKGIDFSNFGALFTTSITAIYTVDVTFGALGYLLTLRVLDAHIRSTEPTFLGWACTLVCYPPVSTMVLGGLLAYKGPVQWYDLLVGYPVVYITWGFAIMVLLTIYVWSTVSFGICFSNLTNRGIIVGGPYSMVKHPAYLSKNLAWWMIYVPFAAHSHWLHALIGCMALLTVNLIYFIRAKTEERHLTKDPEYVAYSEWMEKNGLWAQMREAFQMLWLRAGGSARTPDVS